MEVAAVVNGDTVSVPKVPFCPPLSPVFVPSCPPPSLAAVPACPRRSGSKFAVERRQCCQAARDRRSVGDSRPCPRRGTRRPMENQRMQSFWTEERDAALRRLIAGGSSFSEAAQAIGGCTRNAAIGRAKRIGISIPSGPRKPRVVTAQPRRIAPDALSRMTTARPSPAPAIEPRAPAAQMGPRIGQTDIHGLRIGDARCRFVVDDRIVGGLYCGEDTRSPTCSWCDDHRRVCFNAATPAASRRAPPRWQRN